MAKLLVIDTSSRVCAVGLLIEGKWQQIETETPRQAAQEVLGLISALLEERCLALSQLDAIAITSGPGSFTGLRIGIGIVQGLAESTKLPVIAISNLALFAYTHLKDMRFDNALVCVKARDEESYWAHYQKCQQLGVKLLGAEKVLKDKDQEQAFKNAAKSAHCLLVGDGWDAALLGEMSGELRPDSTSIQVTLSDVAEMAERYLVAKVLLKPEQLTPNYVKEELDYLS